MEVGGCSPVHAGDRLDHLERVPHGMAERLVHRRDLAHRRLAGLLADRDHQPGELLGSVAIGHERALADLDVEQDGVGAGSELLRHHRCGDQPGSRHGAGHVAQRVEQPICGHEPIGLGDHGAADAHHLVDQLAGREPDPKAGNRLELVERATRMREPAPRHLRDRHVDRRADRRDRERRLVSDPARRVLVDDPPTERREVDRLAGVDHRGRQGVRLDLGQTAKEHGHRPRAHLLGRDDAAAVPVDQPRDLLRGVLAAIALLLDQIDGAHRSDLDRVADDRTTARAEPSGGGRADVREEPVMPSSAATSRSMGEQQRVLARVIRRWRRRVAAVV